MVRINNNRSGRKNCDQVVGRLPPHIDPEQRYIVVKGQSMGKTEENEKAVTRVFRNTKLSIENDEGEFVDIPSGYAGRQQTAVEAPRERAPRNNMIGQVATPEHSPMNRAARRREEAKNRRG